MNESSHINMSAGPEQPKFQVEMSEQVSSPKEGSTQKRRKKKKKVKRQ